MGRVVTTPRKALSDRRRKVAITVEARRLFLEAIEAGWSAARAAEVAGVERQRFFERRLQDAEFAEAWQAAFDRGTDALRDELVRRSREGWEEVTRGPDGEVIRRTERPNPADLHLELKRRDPSYREGAQIAIGAGPGDLASASQAEIEASVARFLESVARLAERQRAREAAELDVRAGEGEWTALPLPAGPAGPGTEGRGPDSTPPGMRADPSGYG
jgi:hypothetical protein